MWNGRYQSQRIRAAMTAAIALLAFDHSPSAAAADGGLGAGLMSAIVDLNGNLQRGAGVISAQRLNQDGQYEVIFDRDVTQCTYVAMIGRAMYPRTSASVARRTSQPTGVFVLTSTGATPVNADFHLTVFCGQ